MTLTDSALGRRLQLARGAHWLYAVNGEPYVTGNGDPYAKLLRGLDDDPAPSYDQLRERGPWWHSRVGTWVTADYQLGSELLDNPALAPWEKDGLADPQQFMAVEEVFFGVGRAEPDTLGALDTLGGLAEPLLGSVDEQRSRVTQACRWVIDAVNGEFNLITDVAEQIPVQVLADLLGLSGPRVGTLAELCGAASVAVDSLLCPQQLDVTRRMLNAIRDLRGLFGQGDAGAAPADTGALGMLLAVVGVRTATDIVSKSMLELLDHPNTAEQTTRLADDPGYASQFVDETLRYDPPVHLQAMQAVRDLDVAGERVAAGTQVVVAIGAANRDQRVFADPGLFDPDRAVEPTSQGLSAGGCHQLVVPFARLQAEVTLQTITTRLPGLRRPGPVLRRRRAPVTRALLRIPAIAN